MLTTVTTVLRELTLASRFVLVSCAQEKGARGIKEEKY